MLKKSSDAKIETAIQSFLSKSKILIVDQNSSARLGLKKLTISIGASLHLIHTAGSYEEAIDLIDKNDFSIIFSDYKINQAYGLEILSYYHSKLSAADKKVERKLIFILVTSNTSQSAVAQAAEGDVDAYVLKPYTIDNFTATLYRVVKEKLSPSMYSKLIAQGKDLLEENKFEEALKVFSEAVKNDEKPSLAYYYEGLAYFKREIISNSEKSYNQGLSYNKIHYKCLVGLFDLFMLLKHYEQAYEIVQRIVKYFPSNPQRLSSVLRLAILTKHYADIEIFYEQFLKLENRNEELVKTICAALIVCARYFFENSENKQGSDLIQKAVVTSAGRPLVLKKAIELLIEFNEKNGASDVLSRFSIQTSDDRFFVVSKLLFLNKFDSIESFCNQALLFTQQGFEDQEIFVILVARLKELGKEKLSEEIKEKAIKIFPELKSTFDASEKNDAA